MSEREQLELQIQQLEEEASTLRRLNNETGYIMKMSEVNAKRAELEQIELAKQQQEAVIADVQSPESSFHLSAGGYTADFRDLAIGEDEYQKLSIVTRLYLAQVEREHADEIKAIKDSFYSDLSTASQKNDLLEGELEQTRADLADVRGKLEIANNQITDIEIERDSAVKEAEAQRKQVEELREKITDKPIITNLNGAAQLAEINARIEAKKIPVYDVKEEFRSGQGTFTTFKFAETGEPGDIIWTSFNSKYRVLKEEEVQRFRQEIEEAKQWEPISEVIETAEPTETVEVTIEAPTFQDAHTVSGVDGDTIEAEGVQNHDGGTVEERLTALELAVFGQAKAAA